MRVERLRWDRSPTSSAWAARGRTRRWVVDGSQGSQGSTSSGRTSWSVRQKCAQPHPPVCHHQPERIGERVLGSSEVEAPAEVVGFRRGELSEQLGELAFPVIWFSPRLSGRRMVASMAASNSGASNPGSRCRANTSLVIGTCDAVRGTVVGSQIGEVMTSSLAGAAIDLATARSTPSTAVRWLRCIIIDGAEGEPSSMWLEFLGLAAGCCFMRRSIGSSGSGCEESTQPWRVPADDRAQRITQPEAP